MRVLVACEFSGVVRDAFAALGHDAWSCDLLPSETNGQHIRDDVLKHLDDGWDLMIAHPPCTYLSRSGAIHYKRPGRMEKRIEAMGFFMRLWAAPIDKICLENPEGFPRNAFRHPDQVINPFEFGHRERKKTLLWFKNLPPLFATLLREPEQPHMILPNGKKVFWTHAQHGGKNRSRTFPGIAKAMAEQWGGRTSEASEQAQMSISL